MEYVDDVHQVKLLDKEAVQLFCINASKGNYIESDYETLTREALSHVQGHPFVF